jgi:general secretion pathway protein E
MMILDSSLKSLILKTYDSNQIKNEAVSRNMITLREDGVQEVLSGISTIEEILRVTQK